MTVLLLGDAERMPSWIGVGFKFMPMGRSAPSAIETTVGCVSGEAWPARRPSSYGERLTREAHRYEYVVDCRYVVGGHPHT